MQTTTLDPCLMCGGSQFKLMGTKRWRWWQCLGCDYCRGHQPSWDKLYREGYKP